MSDLIEQLNACAEDYWGSLACDAADKIESQAAEIARLRLSEELAWGLIANSYHSDWNLASDEWQRSAARWRDKYHAALKETGK